MIDWGDLMRLGLRHLHLHPRDFWALTPGELMMMLGLDQGPNTLTRAGLSTLMAAYPDMKKDKQNE